MTLTVIGAGLGRTGTASLKVALEQLGIGRCYHMGELMANPAEAPLWVRAAEGKPDWEQLLGDCGATVDYPGCAFWRELADYYPAAKVLLSVRDANQWFESTQATIFSPQVTSLSDDGFMSEFFQKVVYRDFAGGIHDREFMIDLFERHSEEIRRAIPKDRLLIYEVKQGWAPLCDFLGLPVPDMPFPRVNTREETKQIIESMLANRSDENREQHMSELSGKLFRNRSET